MIYETRDIVLPIFPFADQTSRKRRPVVIVSSEPLHRERGEYIGLMITSHEARNRWDVLVTDWRQSALLFPSVVRVSKVFGLEQAIITRRLRKMSERYSLVLWSVLEKRCIDTSALKKFVSLAKPSCQQTTGFRDAEGWGSLVRPLSSRRRGSYRYTAF